MEIDHRRMAIAAKNRHKVILADGRTATLVFWPIPYTMYKSPRVPKGRKATVLIDGNYVSIHPDDIVMAYTTEPNGTVKEVYECK
jgi:hypothetical protein